MTKIITIITIIACTIIIACATPASAEAVEDVYAMTTVVVELDYDNDAVVCVDFNGNEWAFYGIEDWLVGDVATLVMWNAETDIIYDDEVLDVYYSGWFTPEQVAQWLNH